MFKVTNDPEHEHGRSFLTLVYFGLLFFALLARKHSTVILKVLNPFFSDR